MRFVLHLLLLCFSLNTVEAALPPLLDRTLFFGDPEIAAAQISPDGQYIAFMKPLNKTRNVWVKKTSEPFSTARPVTAEKDRPVAGYFWSRDSKYILFVKDKGGDENFNVYAVSPSAPPPAGKEVPEARNLTDAKGARAQIFEVPRSKPDIIYVGLNDRDKAWHDLYEVKISTGERKLVRQNTDRITGWMFDLNDQLRLATRSADNGDTEVMRVDADKLTKVYSCTVMETCAPVHFHKDGNRVYMMTNKGAGADLLQLTLFDPNSQKEEFVEKDPLGRVDLTMPMFSEKSESLIGTIYVDERRKIYWKDQGYETDYQWLQKKLPNKEISFVSHTTDENIYLVSANSDTEPGETYLFNRPAKKLTLEYRIKEEMPRDDLAMMKPIRYKSSDGLEIPAYLTLPKGVEPKNLPVLMFPHGGPWARDFWGFNPLAQFWANRGYAVLSMNFRGSTGYGKKFLDAGNKQWGQKMQDDITWGAKYLVAEGIANPKRVGIIGGSYGGYATLAGVAFTPDIYAAAVAIVAPSNLVSLLETIPPYWEAGRKTFYERMGNPNTPEGRAQLERQSPLNSADKIRTPLMVVQGANDPRVNKRESDQIVVALRDRGFPVEYLVADDEGHGFAKPVNNLALFAEAEKFFAKYLDARYQESMTPEVAQRLKEISVDPQTVVLTKKLDAGARETPKPELAPKPGTYRYVAKITAGPQTITMNLSTEIKDGDGGWTFVDTAKTPMGEAVETAIVEKGSLLIHNRKAQQGPMSVDLTYQGPKVTGSMSMGGKEQPVSVDLGGPAFADAAGAPFVIGCLDLKEGYSTVYRNFDLQKQKAKILQLQVTGSEKVTVPAGSFDAFRVEVTNQDNSAEKITYWIAKDTRSAVKIAASLPQMGGATMTAELQ
jgi:dipeptidyl aminopeptidase/acylaminoacyl peptidase